MVESEKQPFHNKVLFVCFKSDMQLPPRFSNDELYAYHFFM